MNIVLTSTNRVSNIIYFGIFSLLMAWIIAIPPFQNADEGAHYIKACSNPRVETHPARGYGHYYDLGFSTMNEVAKVQEIRKAQEKFSFRSFFSETIEKTTDTSFYPHAVPNTLVPYALPYIACRIGDLFEIKYQAVFYFIKFSFVFSFLALLFWVKNINPRIFIGISPLLFIPMVINQGAAIGADYFSIASCLIFGVIVAEFYRGREVGRWVLALSVFFLLNTKITYVLFGLVLLPLMLRKYEIYFKLKYLWPTFGMGIFAGVLQYYYQTRKSYQPHLQENFSVQMERLKDSPLDFVYLVISTIQDKWEFYLKSMIGFSGWFTTPISDELMWLTVALLLAWFFPRLVFIKTKLQINYLYFLTIVVVALATVGLIFLSMLLYWTHPSKELIEGVQGRYFLPVLAFLGPVIYALKPTPDVDRYSVFLSMCLFVVCILFLLQSILPYFHGVNVF